MVVGQLIQKQLKQLRRLLQLVPRRQKDLKKAAFNLNQRLQQVVIQMLEFLVEPVLVQVLKI
jgi:hypothetical protein